MGRAILRLCNLSKDYHDLEWLFGLPLYSLLTEISAPFEDITLKKNSELDKRWESVQDPLHLNELRSRTFNIDVR